MKKKIITVLVATLLSSLTVSYADYNYGCQKKESNLLRQLQYAKQYNNHNRVMGLERALANVRQYCGKNNYNNRYDDRYNYSSNDSYDDYDDIDNEAYIRQLTKKIRNQKEKVAEAKEELAEARASGKAKKIRDKSEKLHERQSKLNYYISELTDLER